MDDREIEKQRTAHHEAGHAVASQLSGFDHHVATMRVRDTGWFKKVWTSTGESTYGAKTVEGKGHLQALVTLAGPLAEARWRHLNEDAPLDQAEKQVAAEQSHGDYTQVHVYLKAAGLKLPKAEREARAFVAKHWKKIEKVAAVLAKKNKVSGAAVRRLVR